MTFLPKDNPWVVQGGALEAGLETSVSDEPPWGRTGGLGWMDGHVMWWVGRGWSERSLVGLCLPGWSPLAGLEGPIHQNAMVPIVGLSILEGPLRPRPHAALGTGGNCFRPRGNNRYSIWDHQDGSVVNWSNWYRLTGGRSAPDGRLSSRSLDKAPRHR